MNFSDIILYQVLPYLAPVLTGVLGAVLMRTKYKQEIQQMRAQIEGSELDNVEKGLQIYRSIITDLRNRVEQLEKENRELRSDIVTLKNKLPA